MISSLETLTRGMHEYAAEVKIIEILKQVNWEQLRFKNGKMPLFDKFDNNNLSELLRQYGLSCIISYNIGETEISSIKFYYYSTDINQNHTLTIYSNYTRKISGKFVEFDSCIFKKDSESRLIIDTDCLDFFLQEKKETLALYQDMVSNYSFYVRKAESIAERFKEEIKLAGLPSWIQPDIKLYN